MSWQVSNVATVVVAVNPAMCHEVKQVAHIQEASTSGAHHEEANGNMMDGFLSELGMVLSALAGQQAASPRWARLYDNVARYAIKMGLVRASHAHSNCVVDCDCVATVG